MLSHQKAAGTTTRLCFSVAHHCTKKREVKRMFPSQPTTFQKCHSIPRNLPSCQMKFVSQSIRRRVKLRAAPTDKEGDGAGKAPRSNSQDPRNDQASSSNEPHETRPAERSRLESSASNYFNALSTILRKAGWEALASSMGAVSLTKTLPASSSMIAPSNIVLG